MNETVTVASAKPWASGTEQPFVRIERITKKFGDFYAVDDVSLDIYKGELFCLLGGSGCGKSTLLRMLAGFETPTVGTDRDRRPGHDRHPALRAADQHDVPVLRAVPAHDGREERRLRAEARRHAAATRSRDRVAEMLKLVQLEHFAGRKPHQLSGGQRQRVALAREPGQAAEAAAARRAARRARQEAARGDPVRAGQDPGDARRHLHRRHPRPGGGDDALHPHRGDERRARSSRSASRRRSTSTRARASSPTSSARSTCSRAGSPRTSPTTSASRARRPAARSTSATASPARSNQTLWFAIRPEKLRLTRERPGRSRTTSSRRWSRRSAYLGNLSIYRLRLETGKVLQATKANLSRFDDRRHLLGREGLGHLGRHRGRGADAMTRA